MLISNDGVSNYRWTDMGGLIMAQHRTAVCYTLLALSALAPRGAAQHAAVSRAEPSDTGTSPYAVGDRVRLRSAKLGEGREVIVTVPAGYATGTGRYPVVYVFDGAEYAMIATTAVRALAGSSRMPEAIVVAIVNTDRERDLTPGLKVTKELPPGISHAGGADQFLAFVGDELVPWIDARYRTQPLRTVVGHSLGGLAAAHALASRPLLFRRYVLIDPSLWWDGDAPFAAVARSLTANPDLRAKIAFVAHDSGDLARLLSGAPREVHGVFAPTNEAHENMAYRGIYDGLLALFTDYVPGLRHDERMATVEALATQYATLSRDFGYQVPVPMSALLEVADREANQRRFTGAFAALDRAATSYPASSAIPEWRAQIRAQADAAVKAGLGPIPSVIQFSAVSATQAARVLGDWNERTTVVPGSPTEASARFERRGNGLILQLTAYKVAADGGDFRVLPSIVEIKGDTIRWERENRGGGHILVTARFTPDGRIVGEETVVGAQAMPPGITPPRVTVVLMRR